MYENMSGKLKGLAITMAILGVVGSVVSGLSLMLADDDLILTGFLTMAIGALASWISSWTLYGLGVAIENTEAIIGACNDIMRRTPNPMAPQPVNQSYNSYRPMASQPNMPGWRCVCGRVNPPYQTSCICGATKQAIQQSQQQQ